MTNQEKKDYLRQYRDAEREEKRLTGEIELWRSRAESMTAGYGPQTGGGGDGRKLEQVAVRIADLTDDLIRQRSGLVQLRREIGAAIDAVPDARLRELLRLRYIDGLTFEQIAVRMNYGWRQILRLHGKALTEFEAKMS